MPDLVGKDLGPYHIVEKVGRGGMATVYRAYHEATDRYVAIKVLPEEMAEDPRFLERFDREAKIVAGLQHINVLSVFDYGQQEGIAYLVMPYVPTGSLKDYMSHGPLSLQEATRLFCQIAEATGYAHKKGIIHRDIKPSNVLMDDSGNALLADFGLTRMAKSQSSLTGSGVIGTPDYMSPEQGQGFDVDERSDIYSLGIMLYEMLVGHVPFSAETPIAVIFKHISQPLPLPRSKRPDLPQAVEDVMLKALAKEPENRFQSAEELADAMQRAASGAPVDLENVPARIERKVTGAQPDPSPADVGSPTVAGRPTMNVERDTASLDKRSSKLPLLAGAGVLVVIVAAAAILLLASGAPAEDPSATETALAAADIPTATLTVESQPTATHTFTPPPTHTFTATPPPSDTPSPSFTPTALPQRFCTGSVSTRSNLYVSPNGVIQGYADAGDTLHIVGRETTDTWYRVRLEGGIRAWIAANLIEDFQCPADFTLPAAVLTGATDALWSAIWSPEGDLVFGASEDGTIYGWDPITGQRQMRLESHTAGVTAIDWLRAPDGSAWLASASWDTTIKIWGVDAGEAEATFNGNRFLLYDVAWQPNPSGDTYLLAAASADEGVHLWAIRAGPFEVEGGEDAVLEGHVGEVRAVAWSPDGQYLASVGNDKTVRIWAPGKDNDPIATLKGHTSVVLDVDWSPDGTRLASASFDGAVRLWEVRRDADGDIVGGEPLARLEKHDLGVLTVAWSPDGRYLASGGSDQTVRVWDASNGQQRVLLEGHVDEVRAVAWSPDGSQIASAGADRTVQLWHLLDLAPSASLSTETAPSGTPTEEAAPTETASPTPSGTPTEEASPTEAPTASAPTETALTLCEAAITTNARLRAGPNGAQRDLISEGTDVRVLGQDSTGAWYRLWLEDGSRAWVGASLAAGLDCPEGYTLPVLVLAGHAGAVRTVSWQPGGDYLASAGDDKSVVIWSIAEGERAVGLRGHAFEISGSAWSPDGGQLVTVDSGSMLQVWQFTPAAEDTPAAGQRAFSSTSGAVRFNDVAWQGARLAVASADSLVYIWTISEDGTEGEEVALLEGHTGGVNAVAWSPDGAYLASAGVDGTVRTWSPDGDAVAVFEDHADAVMDVVWSPDGPFFATAGADRTVRVWRHDAEDGAVEILEPGKRLLAVAWSPDGRYLAAGAADGAIHVWETEDWEEVAVLEGHLGEVHALTWAPGGAWFASGGDDSTVRLWAMP